MALVAYDSSDESDSEKDDASPIGENINFNTITSMNNIKPSGKYELIKSSIAQDESETVVRSCRPTLFSRRSDNLSDDDDDDDEEDNLEPLSFVQKLPSVTLHTLADESRIPKSSRLNALFSLSSQQIKTNDEIIKKRSNSTEERFGLFSVLPTPSSDKSKQPAAISEKSVSSKSLPSKLIPRSIKPGSSTIRKEDNDDEEIGADFFSLSKVNSMPEVFEPIDIDTLKTSYGIVQKTPTVTQLEKIPESQQIENYSMDCDNISNAMPDISGVALDEDAMQKLCGRKRKGQAPDEIQLIDVFEDKILAESKEERLKRLSEEVSYRPAVKRGTGPSSQEKRKHQITYLASLAKSRELDLKNMWAQNKFTKRQTQSKYGF